MALRPSSHCLVAALCLAAAGSVFAVEPEKLLPEWAQLSLRFTVPPVIGSDTELVAEAVCLLGDGETATLAVRLPTALKVVGGAPSCEMPLLRGRRQRLVVRVRVAEPCPEGQIVVQLAAAFPRRAVEREVIARTKDSELQRERLQMVRRLDDLQTLALVRRIHVSHFESVALGHDVLWRRIARGPSGKGLFILRESPRAGNRADVEGRMTAFERHERILNRRPDLRAKVDARAAEGRRARIAAYGEDLFALATLLYADEPAAAPAVAALAKKADETAGISVETRLSLQNLAALAYVQRGDMQTAVHTWGRMAESPEAGSLRAYALYNAGEALRLAGKRDESVEMFRGAVGARPGLTVARKRLP